MNVFVKPALRFSGFRVVIGLHLVAVLIFGVLAELDMHGMLTAQTLGLGKAIDVVAALFVGAAMFAIYICPVAMVVLAFRRGWCLQTGMALVAEVALAISHALALTILCR